MIVHQIIIIIIIVHSVATAFYANCTRWPGGAKGVIARNSCLSGFGGEHPSPSGRHPFIVSLCHWHIPWPVLIHLVLIGRSTTWSLTWKTVILGQAWSSNWRCTDRVLTCWAVEQRARFLAAQAPHSGDWLLALPTANCGLCLDDEAVRVAVGMRLGLSLCIPHNCHWGTLVDAQGLHAMVCKKAPGKIARHHVLMTSFGEPSVQSKSPLD